MDEPQRLRHDGLFSRLGRSPVFSMSQLGFIKDLHFDKLNPCYFGKNKSVIDNVRLPSELAILQKVAPNSFVWYNADVGASGREVEGAFRVDVTRIDPPITFTIVYGASSGLMSLWILHPDPIKCVLPENFDLQAFIKLFQSDVSDIESFAIENGVMTDVLRERLKRDGF